MFLKAKPRHAFQFVGRKQSDALLKLGSEKRRQCDPGMNFVITENRNFGFCCRFQERKDPHLCGRRQAHVARILLQTASAHGTYLVAAAISVGSVAWWP